MLLSWTSEITEIVQVLVMLSIKIIPNSLCAIVRLSRWNGLSRNWRTCGPAHAKTGAKNNGRLVFRLCWWGASSEWCYMNVGLHCATSNIILNKYKRKVWSYYNLWNHTKGSRMLCITQKQNGVQAHWSSRYWPYWPCGLCVRHWHKRSY